MAVTREQVNEILKIKENYELPEKLLADMLDDERRQEVFGQFLNLENDLSKDFLRDYFQEEHGDRNALKQDYTPDAICKIIAGIISEDKPQIIGDICAGSGALTISAMIENDGANYIYCEELSKRVLPILIFNLAIRNMAALVNNGDSLKMEFEAAYKITPGERFSSVEKIEAVEPEKVDAIISNPPYSLKWEQKEDERFEGFGIAPKTKADYAFLLHGLSLLKDDGVMVVVLPHGVLFRGSKEADIRKALIEKNHIEAVIGLPDHLFMNTGIPVCLVVLRKKRREKGILFINADKEFVKGSPQNYMTDEQIEKVVRTYLECEEIEKYSHLAHRSEVEENDYNLNIPRYAANFEEEPVPDINESLKELIQIDKEIAKIEKEMLPFFKDMVGTDPEEEKDCRKTERIYSRFIKSKYSDDAEEQQAIEVDL